MTFFERILPGLICRDIFRCFIAVSRGCRRRGLFELRKIGSDSTAAWGPTILATVIAFVVGYAVIAWLLRYVATRSFLPFVIYRIILGLIVMILLLMGVVPAT